MLSEWRNSLVEGSWVSDLELSVLKAMLVKFIDRSFTHIEDDELKEMIEDHNHYTGG